MEDSADPTVASTSESHVRFVPAARYVEGGGRTVAISVGGTSVSERALALAPRELLIGGVWRPASGSAQRLSVNNPATGQIIADVADASPADAVAALDAASSVQLSWAVTSPRTRADILRRAFDLVMARADDLATLLTTEMGKPLAEARGEIAYGADFLRYYSESVTRMAGRYGTNPAGTGRTQVAHYPVGPCLLITPWNFPLAMATRKIAPALAAGCTVVLKPSELTPLTSLALASIMAEAGLPEGVLNVVTTSAAGPVTEPLMRDRRLRKISFTGSTPVGVHLLETAAAGVLRTSMELGGNAPFLVFEDADLDTAVDAAMAAKFRNAGQACTAANRFLVHVDVAGEFTQRIAARAAALKVGRGTEIGVDIGPLIDSRAVTKVRRLKDDALASGARLVFEGDAWDGPGSFIAPAVVDQVSSDSLIWREEIFGPVLAIRTFETEAEAIRLANDTDYGLVSYVCTRDEDRARRVSESMDSGMVGVNVGVVSDATAPFGGWKLSGIGREGGPEGLHDYLQTKYTLAQTESV